MEGIRFSNETGQGHGMAIHTLHLGVNKGKGRGENRSFSSVTESNKNICTITLIKTAYPNYYSM